MTLKKFKKMKKDITLSVVYIADLNLKYSKHIPQYEPTLRELERLLFEIDSLGVDLGYLNAETLNYIKKG